jgi:UDP-2,3-diacylglucosamine hydrolase
MQRIEQPVVIELGGRRTVLCHGDQLCTLDAGYQRYRNRVLDPQWQARMLAKPLWLRRAIAGLLRRISGWRNRDPSAIRMDVAQSSVQQMMLEHEAELMIHGHTHRPARHPFTANGRSLERIVLGDWYSQGSVLIARGGELELQSIDRD